MKTITRIDERKKVFASNRQFIQHIANLTDYNYNLLVYEIGDLFLETLFPAVSSFEKYKAAHERSRNYWLWWMAEFKKWEDNFLQEMEDNKIVTISPKFYGQQILSIVNCKNIESSFNHNYLKHHQHGLL